MRVLTQPNQRKENSILLAVSCFENLNTEIKHELMRHQEQQQRSNTVKEDDNDDGGDDYDDDDDGSVGRSEKSK